MRGISPPPLNDGSCVAAMSVPLTHGPRHFGVILSADIVSDADIVGHQNDDRHCWPTLPGPVSRP